LMTWRRIGCTAQIAAELRYQTNRIAQAHGHAQPFFFA
jgi:hypothetical protein